jgi:hypothetical protein
VPGYLRGWKYFKPVFRALTTIALIAAIIALRRAYVWLFLRRESTARMTSCFEHADARTMRLWVEAAGIPLERMRRRLFKWSDPLYLKSR